MISESNPSKVPPGNLKMEQIMELCLYSAKLIKTKKIKKRINRIPNKTKETVIHIDGFLSVYKILQQQ